MVPSCPPVARYLPSLENANASTPDDCQTWLGDSDGLGRSRVGLAAQHKSFRYTTRVDHGRIDHEKKEDNNEPYAKDGQRNHALPCRNAGAELVEFLRDRFDGAPLRRTAKSPATARRTAPIAMPARLPMRAMIKIATQASRRSTSESSPRRRRCRVEQGRTSHQSGDQPDRTMVCHRVWPASVQEVEAQQMHARSSNNVVSSGPLPKHSREITIRSRETTTPTRAAAQIGFTTRM